MARRAATGRKAKGTRKPAAGGGATKETARAEDFDKLEVVEELLREVAEELRAKKGKPTVSDFIRLMELEKELRGDKPAAIEVTWVDPKLPGDPKSKGESER